MGAAGAVPAARAVSAMTGMTSKITNLVNRLKPQLRAGFADNMLVSRNANLYNPLDKRIQAFEEDYRAGAHADETGRLTRDSEGRDLTAPFVVGRRTLQGADVPLGAQEVESVAKAATGKEPTPVARTEIGGYAGSYQVVRDRRSGRVLDREIFYDKNASPKQQERIIAHELSHAIDEIAGRIPTDDIKTDLKRIYNTLNTGQERTRNLTGPQHFGYRGQDIDKELGGEAIRAYMANPNYLKSVAPRVAARIREYVNPHPELSKIIQFNALGGAVAIPALSTNDGGQQ